MRVTIVLLMMLFFGLVGCTDRKEQEDLARKNAELKNELAARDRFVEDVTSAINEIHDAIESTWAKEKNVVRETTKPEGKVAQTTSQVKQQILARISDMHSTIMQSRKKIADLQRKLDEAGVRFAGLQRMVDDLKKELEGREQAILQLQARVDTLQSEVSEKTEVIAARDQTIEEQTRALNKVYYVVGTRDELKERGIIMREGGFLWGLFGSTTVLSPSFKDADFQRLDKTKELTVKLPGAIDEIVPKRDTSWYNVAQLKSGGTVLKIVDPASFWRQNHLVIVTE